jgi:uncharacterized membrane protein YdjX (TVP38/TMEM64 family)
MQSNRYSRKLAAAVLLVLVGAVLCFVDRNTALPGLEWLSAQHMALMHLAQANPWLFGIGFFGLFVFLSALSLPGCSVLAMGAGLCFGFVGGTLLVVLASTVGATLPFLAARHWARDRLRERWGGRLAKVEDAIARDGALYLFMLRLAPVIPFPVLNPLMGLSSMPTVRFFWVSLLGMLAGSAAYVQAGIELQRASAGGAWASPTLVTLLLALLLLPVLARRLWLRARAA